MKRQVPTYQEFVGVLERKLAARSDVILEPYARVAYLVDSGEKNYDLFKISSRFLGDSNRVLLIRAGIHGDEIGGPLALMADIDQHVEYAHQKGVALLIYPLDNPSGFEAGTRYNVEGDHGDAGNNDFLRYELENGTHVDDIGKGAPFKSWRWSSDPSLHIHLPKETLALHQELHRVKVAAVRAALDIHQDNYLSLAATYHYAFDDSQAYASITSEIEKHGRILKNAQIDSGYFVTEGYRAEQISSGKVAEDNFNPLTDERGQIIRHDGTLPDLLGRLGARHAVTLETTSMMSQETVDKITSIWVRGLTDLIA